MAKQKPKTQIYDPDTLFVIMRVYSKQINDPAIKDMAIRRFQKIYYFLEKHPEASKEVSDLLTRLGKSIDDQEISSKSLRSWTIEFTQIRKKYEFTKAPKFIKKPIPYEKVQKSAQIYTADELFIEMKSMVKNIDNSSIKDMVIRRLQRLDRYASKKPESINSIKKFLKELDKKIINKTLNRDYIYDWTRKVTRACKKIHKKSEKAALKAKKEGQLISSIQNLQETYKNLGKTLKQVQQQI